MNFIYINQLHIVVCMLDFFGRICYNSIEYEFIVGTFATCALFTP